MHLCGMTEGRWRLCITSGLLTGSRSHYKRVSDTTAIVDGVLIFIMIADHSAFSFLRFIDISPSEAHEIHLMPVLQRRLKALHRENKLATDAPYMLCVRYFEL